MHILRCMGSKFCVKFQRAPLNPLRLRQSLPIFRSTNHKRWCQPTGGHVSYQNGSPIATRQGLWSSLHTSWAIFPQSSRRTVAEVAVMLIIHVTLLVCSTGVGGARIVCKAEHYHIMAWWRQYASLNLRPAKYQAITWTNVDVLPTGPLP